jgi:ribosomal protein S17
VMIIETRPLSRNKNWRVQSIVKEAALPGGGA